MTASLSFHPDALKEWRSLDKGVRLRLKKKLASRLLNPGVSAARLSGRLSKCYKIKDSTSGYRLIYQFDQTQGLLFVLAIAKRENLAVYKIADYRKA